MPASGGTFQLFEGTFNTTDTIEIPSNTSLRGMGIGNTTIVGSGADTHYNVIENEDTAGGNTDISIRDMTVDGNWVTGAAAVWGGAVQFIKCTDSSIIDVEVHHAYQHDVMISRSQRIHLVRLDCHDAQGDDCITVTDGAGISESEYIWIIDCYVHDSGTETYQSGIEVDDGPQWVYIEGCVCENIFGSDFNGHIHVDGLAIKHIYFRNCTGTGLIVYNSSLTEVFEDIEVSGCSLNGVTIVNLGKHVHVIDNPSLGWVYISQISEDIRVCNNTISNPGDGQGGIEIVSSVADINSVLIQGNTISTAAQAGIFIDVRAGRTITYLNILDNIGYPVNWQTVALQGPGTADHVKITGNQCHGAPGISINPTPPFDLTLTNWIIEDNPGLERKPVGMSTMLAADTLVSVASGVDKLASTKANARSVFFRPADAWGNSTQFWGNISAGGTVNVNVDIAPGADTDFYWEVDATRGATWTH